MPLSDEQLLKIFDAHYSFASGHTAYRTKKALRAVEAAVRADQIEKDAAIAAGVPASHYDFEGYPTWPSPREVAAAIRAQLNGDSNAEDNEYTPTTVQVEVSDEAVQVFWYEHDCEWLSKYCDEHHRRSALVPRSALGGGE